MSRTLIVLAGALGLGACLDFSECPSCVDAGPPGCQTANLMQGPFAPLSGVPCSMFDAGENDAEEMASGTCGSGDGGWGVESSFSRPATSGDAGIYLCARLIASELPNLSSAIAFHCGICDEGAAACGCGGQPATCTTGRWSGPGPAMSGPFLLPATSCATVDVTFSVSNSDAGTFAFGQGWAWQTTSTAGCTWNDVTGCPGP